MRRSRRFAAAPSVALVALVVSASPCAAAGGRRTADACFTAPVEAQKLRRAGQLLDARARFLDCARPACPADIAQPCTRWAQDVERALPSVVLVARDAQGRDRSDAQVAIDGQTPVEIRGRAVELDPGSHTFVFHLDGNADVERQSVLHEGEKDREVLAVFPAPAPTPVPAPQSSYVSAPPPAEAAPDVVPAVTWVAGGIGLVALASFATFGTLGVVARNADGCAAAPGCSQPQLNDVHAKLLAADVSLGVGVAALAVATWVYLARPRGEPAPRVTLDVGFRPGGGVAFVGGAF